MKYLILFFTCVACLGQEQKILSFEFVNTRPATDWKGYSANGTVNWVVASNFCLQARIKYVSPSTCSLYYAYEPLNARTNCNTNGGCVMYPGFIRISGTLPAGTNTIIIPRALGETGFFMVK